MERLNLHQRILSVYKKVTSVIKEGEIEQGNSSYLVVTHDSVTKSLHMPVAEAGILCWPSMKSCVVTSFEREKEYQGKIQKSTWYRADVVASVKFINADDPNQSLESEFHAYAMDTSDKATGKAYSMAIKNIYLKTFMLESLDNEEERKLEGDTYRARPVNHAPQSPNSPSEAQIKRYWAMSKILGWDEPKARAYVKDFTQGFTDSPAKLTRQDYDLITIQLQKLIESKKPMNG